MPLLGKHAFIRQKPPSDLKGDEEVFYCKLTHEIFRDYNAFFERIILCNSLVWTCALSGRPGLTYQEALQSEKEARKNLSIFPSHLKRPVLFLATLTRRGRLTDLCDDVFVFLRDRFLIGEDVEVFIDGVKKHCCVITKVIPPEVKKKSTSSEGSQNDEKKSSKKVKPQNPSKYKYEVSENGHTKRHIVKAASINRKKGSYTREKSKLFLKQHITPDNGIWKVKDESASNFKVNEMSFKDIFAGPLPSFFVSPKKKSSHVSGNELKNKESKEKKSIQSKLSKELMDKNKTPKERAALIEKQKQIQEEERIKQRIELKKRLEEEKQKRKEERLKEREKLKEEKKLLAQVMMEWKKPRDDLECDDLKNLPLPTSFDCSIPQELFGDVMMVLEFLHLFGDLINLKDSFPQGFTFDHMEKALTETDVQGCLNDLVQVLLGAIFQFQEEDEEDCNEDALDSSNKSLTTDVSEDDSLSSTIEKASELASVSATWPMLYHGVPLRKMPVDSFSLTEIIRLHFLASGASSKVLKIQGMTSREDPGLWLKVEHPEIVKKLSTTSLFELPIGEKITILKVLVDQLLTSSTFHDTIDENFSKVRHRKNDIKQLQFNFKREKEETSQRYKKLLGEKTKDDEKAKDDKNKDSEKKDASDNEKNASSEGMDSSDISAEDEIVGNEENLSPEEREKLCEKWAVEEAKKKEDFLRKERDIQEEISKLQNTCSILSIGRDRAYRKFWMFNSLPGLFVEEGDAFIGTCLSNPTPYNPNSNPLSTDISQSFKKKFLQNTSDDKSTNSDKENESVDNLSPVQNNNVGTPKVSKFIDSQNSDSSVSKIKNNALNAQPYVILSHLDESLENVNMSPKSETKNFALDKTPVFGMCTSCPATCPVHNTHKTATKWGFYYTQKDIEDLLSSLNQRGFREGALREALLTEKKKLEDLEKCPIHQLNRDLLPPTQLPVRKSNRLHGYRQSAFKGIYPRDALELTLRDMILELEERISIGCLGALKVENRDSWRNAIEYRVFDKESDKSTNLSESDVKPDIKERNSEDSAENNGSDNDIGNNGFSAIPISQVIRDLSNALAEVALGIEYKYLQPPLGDDEETKRQRLKAATEMPKSKSKQKDKKSLEPDLDNGSQSKPTKLPFKRWEESLKLSTSLSQIFVHLSTLERSVVWSRSVLKARCKICRRCSDAENMLLCDGCNRGHHIYCLKPPLTEIPECDWFCSSCKPVEKPPSPRKKRVNYEESDLSEESDDDSDYSEEDADEDDSENDIHGDLCDACNKRGTLICCDSCPLAFHLNCAEPPLKRIPRGSWHCHKCSSSSYKAEKLKEAAKQSSGAYRTRAQAVLATAIKKQHNKNYKKSKSTPEIRDRKRKADNDSDSDYVYKRSRLNTYNNTPEDNKSVNNSRRISWRSEEFVFDYKACSDTLNELTHHKEAWPFLRAVSRTEVPTYYDIIKRPMDFGTVQGKLNNMQYQSNKEFLLDIYLILQNCEVFNPRVSSEYKAGRKLYVALQTILESHGLDMVDIKEKDLLSNLDN